MTDKQTPALDLSKSHVLLGYVDIRDSQYPLWVSKHDYRFTIDLGDLGTVFGTDAESARKTAMDKTKRAKVTLSIPFTLAVSGRDGRITGVHGGTGKLLVQWENGDRDQIDSYTSLLTPLTEAEHAKLDELVAAEKIAKDALKEYRDSHKLDTRLVIEEAIKRSLQEAIS